MNSIYDYFLIWHIVRQIGKESHFYSESLEDVANINQINHEYCLLIKFSRVGFHLKWPYQVSKSEKYLAMTYLNFKCKIFFQILYNHYQKWQFNTQSFFWICWTCDICRAGKKHKQVLHVTVFRIEIIHKVFSRKKKRH